LDASLTFREGSAMWEQDLTIMDCDKTSIFNKSFNKSKNIGTVG